MQFDKLRLYVMVYCLILLLTPSTAFGAGKTPAFIALPGAEALPRSLTVQLTQSYSERASNYVPRTRHKDSDGNPTYINRLFLESSPYLQQHAHNPINWYPWGEAAFAEARRLNRPIFLSVGYATCHWCHVMEEESFENEEIATYLNQHFVAIKVDREERPDVDAIYMQAVVALTGSGGWPMTVLLTPDGRPFYGGTYYPPYDGGRGQPVGLLTLLKQTQANFEQAPEQIEEMGQRLTAFVQTQMTPESGSDLPSAAWLHGAVDELKKRYDPKYGGLTGERKFPSSLPIRLLLRYHRRTGDDRVLSMASKTLHQMAAGGIYDKVGGGFHRYATDPQWRVPHFEKMLYDNAQLVTVYLEAYQVTKDPVFADMVHHILAYIEREMTSSEGVFYSATDADSLTPAGEREEGYFFTWTPDELRALLGNETAEKLMTYYSVTDDGNFEGRNILFRPPGAIKVPQGLDLQRVHQLLYEARAKRPPPLTDDKIVTAWNGMMISALARAGMVFNRADYMERAQRAATYLVERMWVKGQLYRSSRNGQLGPKAFIDDYAALTGAMIDLYEATQSVDWLKKALALDAIVAERFEDKDKGGFFRAEDQGRLIAREKPHIDGALPSGNAIAILNLLRLAELTFDDQYRQRAERAFKAFAPRLKRFPVAFPHLLIAADFLLDEAKEIVVVTPKGKMGQADPFLAVLDQTYLPNHSLTVVEDGRALKQRAKLVPVARGKEAIGGRTTAFVCTAGICELPALTTELFAEQIGFTHPLKPASSEAQP